MGGLRSDFLKLLFQSVSRPGAVPPLSVSGRSALCVGFRRSLALCVGPRRSLAVCVGPPTLSVSGPRALPPLSVSGVSGTATFSLFVLTRHPSGLWPPCHLIIRSAGSNPRATCSSLCTTLMTASKPSAGHTRT